VRKPQVRREGRRPAEETVDREPSVSAGWAAVFFFGLSFLYFLPFFLPGQGPFGTDYLGATYIFHDFIRGQLSQGILPAWVPYVYGGLPLYANPGSTYHPLFLFGSLLLPTSRILGFVFLVQFWMAGLGMFLLVRELGCRGWVSLISGVAFAFTGVTASWVYAGHDGRIMVATLTPLLFFFLLKGIRDDRWPPFVGATATLACALLSFQIQNAYYLLLASGAWAIYLLIRFRSGRSALVHARILGLGIGTLVFAFGLASVNFLPFLDYIPESPRGDPGGRGYEYSVSFSMPVADLLGLAVPEQMGASVFAVDSRTGRMTDPLFPSYSGPNPMKLHTEYVGAWVLLLLLLGAIVGPRRSDWIFFAILGGVALTLAFGGNTPLYRLYYEVLPGLKRFRAPDLAFYVTAFSLVVLAAMGLEALAKEKETKGETPRMVRALPWVVGAGILFGILGAGLAPGAEAGPLAAGAPSRASGWIRFGLAVALTGGVLWAWSRSLLSTRLGLLLLVAITTADLWVVGKRFLQTTPPTESIFVADDVARFLEQQPRPLRVWNVPMAPHRGRDDSYLMHFGVQLAGGEHSTPLQRWNEYVGAGEGLVQRTWANFLEHPAFLDAASVRYLLFQGEVADPSLREVFRGGSAIVYENLNALPPAYLVSEAISVGEGEALAQMRSGRWDPRTTAFVTPPASVALPAPGEVEGEARIADFQPNRVVVETRANRAAVLVLAENYFPGWVASLNGEPLPVFRANHTLRAVVVPPGEHRIEFRFQPTPLRVGFFLYCIGWAILGVLGGFLVWRSRGSQPVAARR